MKNDRIAIKRESTTLKKRKKSTGRMLFSATADTSSSSASAFEVDNAKQLTVDETVQYFVPTEDFVDLISRKNHILLGSRGSGKTTWVRMLAHDHIVLASRQTGAEFQYARDALKRNVVGIYVPTNIGLVGSLKNKPWQRDGDAERFFQWRLNVHSCTALLPIIKSCIEHYIQGEMDRSLAELKVCRELAKSWSRGQDCGEIKTLESLKLLLARIETDRIDGISRGRARGESLDFLNDYFDTELFQPIRFAMEVITFHVKIPADSIWMICIDEAEYLTEAHHRILNTHLRTAAGNLVFKIATMPFAHHTLATNAGDPVRDGHDFDYVYVDQVPIDSRSSKEDSMFLRFARDIFARRMKAKFPGRAALSLQSMLGKSALIEEKIVDSDDGMQLFMNLMKKHANEVTVSRAERLLATNQKRFRSEISRKMHGALVLKDALHKQVGNAKMTIYSGEAVVVRCSDGNARRLMRLLNALSKAAVKQQSRGELVVYPLAAVLQNEVIETIARDTLNRVQSEPPNGVLTHKCLLAIGRYMRASFRSRPLGSDVITSVSVSLNDGSLIQDFVKQAVQLTLLTPSKENAHNGPNAPCEGVFHLAFLFAPLFGLLPRRNKSQRLPKVLAGTLPESSDLQHQSELEI